VLGAEGVLGVLGSLGVLGELGALGAVGPVDSVVGARAPEHPTTATRPSAMNHSGGALVK
jgi:hypothetical protein